MWPRSCRRGSLAAGGRSTERVAARRSSSCVRVRRVGVTPPRWGTFQRDISGSTRTAVVVAHGASAPAAGELREQVSLMEVSKGPVPTPVEPRGPRLPEASSARPVESRESRCPAWSAGPAPGCPPPRSGEGLSRWQRAQEAPVLVLGATQKPRGRRACASSLTPWARGADRATGAGSRALQADELHEAGSRPGSIESIVPRRNAARHGRCRRRRRAARAAASSPLASMHAERRAAPQGLRKFPRRLQLWWRARTTRRTRTRARPGNFLPARPTAGAPAVASRHRCQPD